MGDVLGIVRALANSDGPPPLPDTPGVARDGGLDVLAHPIDELSSAYYMRLTCADQAGVLAQIAQILGDGNISIATVIQKDTDPGSGTAQLVIATYPSREADVQSALRAVSELGVVVSVNNLIRIEE